MALKAKKPDVQLASHGEAAYEAYLKMGLQVAAGDITVSKGKLLLFNRYEISDPSKPEFVLDTLKGMEQTYVTMVPELMDRSVRERMKAARDALVLAGLTAGPVNLWRAVQLQAHGIAVEKKTVDDSKAYKAAIAAAETQEEVKVANFLWNLPPHALGNLKARLKGRVLDDFIEQARKKGVDPVEDHELAIEIYKFVLNSRGEAAWKLAVRSPTILSPASVFLAFSSLGVKLHYQLKEKIVGYWTEDKMSYSQDTHTEEVQRTEMIPHPVTQQKVTAGFWVEDSGGNGHFESREVTIDVRNSYDIPNTGDVKHILFIEKSSLGVLPADTVDELSDKGPIYAGYSSGTHNLNVPTPGLVLMPDGSAAVLATDDRVVFAQAADMTVQPDPSHLPTAAYEIDVYRPNQGMPSPQGATFWPHESHITHTYTEQVVVYGPLQEHHEYREHPITKSSVETTRDWFVEHWDRLVASFVIPLAVLGVTTGYRRWVAFANSYVASNEFRDDLALKMVGQMETF